MPHDFTPDALLMLVVELYTGENSWVAWTVSALLLILGWKSAVKTIDEFILPFLASCGRAIAGLGQGKLGDFLLFVLGLVLIAMPPAYFVSGMILATQLGGYFRSGDVNRLWEVDLSSPLTVLSHPSSIIMIAWTFVNLACLFSSEDMLGVAFGLYFFTLIGLVCVGSKIYLASPPGAFPMSLWNVLLYAVSGFVVALYSESDDFPF